ncbi:MAG: hypothetical protein WKF64_07260 [Ilumatobacteraceae bacterium]
MPVGRSSESTLSARLTATNTASGEIRKVAGELDDLEKKAAVEAKLTANDQASADVRTLSQRLAQLDRQDVEVVLTARADQLQREVDKITRSLRDIEKMSDTEVEIRLTARDMATAKLDDVREQMRRLDQADAEAEVTADTDQAEVAIRRAGIALRDLDGDAARMVVDAEIGTAQAKLREALAGIRDLDGEEAKVRMEAVGTAKADIDRLQTELRDLDGSTTRFNVSADGISEITDKLGGIGALLGSGGGVAAGVAGLVAGLGATALHAGDLAIEADVTARLTGDSVERASALQSVWRTSGADVNDLNDVLLQMNGVLKTNPELAKQLGVNLGDGKTIGERFIEVVDKLGRSNLGAADKALLMSQAFGEEGVRQVARLTTVINGELATAVDDVADTALTDPEDVARSVEMSKATAEMNASFQRSVRELGEGMMPLLTQAAGLATKITEGLPGGSQNTLLNPVTDEDIDEIAHKYGDLMVSTYNAEESQRVWNERMAQAEGFFSSAAAGVAATAGGYKTLSERALTGGLAVDAVERSTRSAEGAFTGMSVEALAGGLAIEAVAESTKLAREAQIDYANTTSSMDWGRAGLEGGLVAMSGYSTAMYGLHDISANFEGSLDALGSTLEGTRLHMDLTTEAGRKQYDAVKNVASAVNTELAAAYVNADGDMDKFKDTAQTIADDTLARMKSELGLTDDEVNLLRESLGLTDGDWEARFKMSGTEEARVKVGLLQGSIDDLPKDVQARVNQRIIKGDYVGALNEIQGVYDRYPVRVGVNPYAQNHSAAWYSLQSFYDRYPLSVSVIPQRGNYAAGGVVGRAGGLAGENFRPEFDDGRLISSPTAVRTGSRVTSERDTKGIMERLTTALESVAAGPSRGGGGSSTIINHFPAGADPTSVVRAQQRYAERNGLT